MFENLKKNITKDIKNKTISLGVKSIDNSKKISEKINNGTDVLSDKFDTLKEKISDKKEALKIEKELREEERRRAEERIRQRNRINEYVCENSDKYRYYLNLNQKYRFLLKKEKYIVEEVFRNRKVYELCFEDEIKSFKTYIYENLKEIKDMVNKIQKDQECFNEYCSAIKNHYEFSYIFDPAIIDLNEFKRIENIECNRLILFFNPSICYKVRYISPKGVVDEYGTFSFDVKNLIKFVKEVEEDIKNNKFDENNKKYEREPIPTSVRYAVLHRDGYKCVVCGRNAKDDGVKLHIDHIVPVSKGGTNNINNLRTLCKDCNLGRSNKYLD